MKRIVLTICCFVALATAAFAQEPTTELNNQWKWNDHPSSLSVNMGAQSFWGMMIGHNNRSFGHYAIRYDYNVLKWLAIGGSLSYEGSNYSRYVYTTSSKESEDWTNHFASVMMELLFTYINREHVQLYSGVAMGLLYEWDGPVGSRAEFKPMLPGWSVIPIGVRAGGKRVYGLAEVTLGTQALMTIGVGVHF